MDELRKFVPNAKNEDWVLETAGQRVQIIKKEANKGGVLKFGTEIINSEDKTIAALLGASPGASTSVSIMLELLNKCFVLLWINGDKNIPLKPNIRCGYTPYLLKLNPNLISIK